MPVEFHIKKQLDTQDNYSLTTAAESIDHLVMLISVPLISWTHSLCNCSRILTGNHLTHFCRALMKH